MRAAKTSYEGRISCTSEPDINQSLILPEKEDNFAKLYSLKLILLLFFRELLSSFKGRSLHRFNFDQALENH